MKFIHRNRDRIAQLESRIAKLEFKILPPFMGIALQAMPVDELVKTVKARQEALRAMA